jgi:hypothetical protein
MKNGDEMIERTTADYRDTKYEVAKLQRKLTPAEVTQGGDGQLIVTCIPRDNYKERVTLELGRDLIGAERQAKLIDAWRTIEEIFYEAVLIENDRLAAGDDAHAAVVAAVEARKRLADTVSAIQDAEALKAAHEADLARLALEKMQSEQTAAAVTEKTRAAIAESAARAEELAKLEEQIAAKRAELAKGGEA